MYRPTKYPLKAVFLSTFISAFLLLIGCGEKSGYRSKQPSKVFQSKLISGEEASLFPSTVGSEWIYNLGVGLDQREMHFKIVESKNSGAEVRLVIEVDVPGLESKAERQGWLINQKGIWQEFSSLKEQKFNPPQLVIPFPIESGKKFEWKGKGPRPDGKSAEYKINSRVVGIQEVDTDMGKMCAYAVESRAEWTQNNQKIVSNNLSWWVPKVGLVRFYSEVISAQGGARNLLKLKSYSVK